MGVLFLSYIGVSAARIEVQDTNPAGPNTALVLDASNNPILVYSNSGTNRGMNVIVCDDPLCAPSAGRSTTTIGSSGKAYYDPKIILDANGYPVIVAFNDSDEILQLFRCTTVDCTSVIQQNIDTTNLNTGRYFSLALDANGYPIIAYTASFANGLKLIHCNDANCAGNDESITFVDTLGKTSELSLVLDANGYPVISYIVNGELRLVRCNDVNCAGNDELNIFLESLAGGSRRNVVQLDNAGFPSVVYTTSDDIKLI